ncbi:hypothetical protein C1752_03232 [Acaryochloris thomasi RCC1774]|uniref:Uncharacterized protein n=1 Tax=Acaryochloris thomasi RCC1774 TaxID=1764569 RepID=A0A2W1JWN1_9CYAN|nr:hypothetical protein [Acaryochloris thomasi]PZD72797.1 hypothetical protein C1752_03232 [Acaryochloris thomasi RCC1774]
MAKTPSLKQRLFEWADYSAFAPAKHSLVMDVVSNQAQATGRWVRQLGNSNVSSQGVAAVVAIALLIWNWPLLIALCIGLSITILASRSTHVSLKATQMMRSLLDSPLLLALTTGLLSVVISYSTILIWQDTGQVGIALAILLQGACLLSVLGLLIGQLLKPPAEDADLYEQWVTQLMTTDPLQRLIAVRRLSRIEVLTHDRRQELNEYFQLLLAQEPQPQIRDAVLLGLRRLDARTASRTPLPRPSRRDVSPRQSLKLKRRRIEVHKERAYAELEAHQEESWVQ